MTKRAARLKVYRTAAGFHDAYVAAPSQKAALEAWGTDKNLFARGAAELVTDPKLTASPMADPGKVIRLSRGSLTEQLAASAASPPPRRKRSEATAVVPERKAKPAKAPKPPKPRPSRKDLDKAEVALADFEAETDRALTDFRARQEALAQERAEFERRSSSQADKLRARIEREKKQHAAAMERWRG